MEKAIENEVQAWEDVHAANEGRFGGHWWGEYPSVAKRKEERFVKAWEKANAQSTVSPRPVRSHSVSSSWSARIRSGRSSSPRR